ncbi:auxin response factor 18-like [Salvia miltiorrhiza]|uniref:auxin response factor 18-like n=1 Tax=Salvia miltiorrhiza TaxID=226208 RepID=UPI0025AC6C05|nr:auxin response factor 18-like [Salvia miltiorrhiza]
MITFMESKERSKESERCLDSQLWHACAGSMVQMPPVNSKVFYFPQGHLEHVCGNLDLRNCPRLPAYVPCRVSAVKFMADPETDEVFAKIRLAPVAGDEVDLDKDGAAEVDGVENRDKPTSFAKTLTQSDANNGGGFSVPRYCAETIFPRLDYSADPPVQTILVKDVHGEVWKFRHIYRGTPRRHLLTTGWSTFVNHKKLVAGDSIVFLRAENGDLCVGVRRAKNGIGGGPQVPPRWSPGGGGPAVPYGGFSMFLREDESKLSRNGGGANNGSLMGKGRRVETEDVVEAATLAANGKPFDVIYYPRASNPEFFVRTSLLRAALQIRWCSGMRFKMAFETEDSSRISWFMGTISSVQVADPVRWPDSPWRLLQVRWDEPDLLQNVKRVNPWSVELVSNLPNIHLSPFSSPHKKLRLLQPPDSPLDGQLPLPAFTGSHHLFGSSYPFGCLTDNAPAGMQGARHGQYGITLSDLHFSKLRSGLLPPDPPPPRPLDRASVATRPSNSVSSEQSNEKNISCLLTMGSSARVSTKPENRKEMPFVLFGREILTEKQISVSRSSSSDCNVDRGGNTSDGSGFVLNRNEAHEREWLQPELGIETDHCKVFMESEDVGRTLNLSLLGSYEELHMKLASMFRVEIADISKHILYRDTKGVVRQLGEEPFGKFSKTARRLRVVVDSVTDNLEV